MGILYVLDQTDEGFHPHELSIYTQGNMAMLLGDAPHRPTSPPIFLCHLCIYLLIVTSPRQNALAAPILESDDHVT